MSKPKVKKKSVALLTSKKTVLQVIADTEHYVQSMTGNTHFTTPSPTLASITTLVNALDAAYKTAESRAKGTVGLMHVALKTLTIALKALAIYVESIANADPDNASSIITSAGMVEKKFTPRAAKTFSVVQTKVSGSVTLNTKAVSRGTYIYQMSTDPTNPASWVTIFTGNTVKFTKTGLTAGVHTYFRGAVILKGVQGEYSPVLGLIVI
jgi:hypothetical protein